VLFFYMSIPPSITMMLAALGVLHATSVRHLLVERGGDLLDE